MLDDLATRFADDAFGRYLKGRLEGVAQWALRNFLTADADLEVLSARAIETFSVTAPRVMPDACWVEYKPGGNTDAFRTSSSGDIIVFHVPLSGTVELAKALRDKSGEKGHEKGHEIIGQEVVCKRERQLGYHPVWDNDPSVARKAGEELTAEVLAQAAVAVEPVLARSQEIQAYDIAMRAVVAEQRRRVEKVRGFQEEFRAGIGLPTTRPGNDHADAPRMDAEITEA